MRNHRQNEIGGIVIPVLQQRSYGSRVVESDDGPQQHQKLRSETRPAFSQDQVVNVLQTDACGRANNIERIEQFLHVEETNLPGIFLSFEGSLQGIGGATMSSPCLKEDD